MLADVAVDAEIDDGLRCAISIFCATASGVEVGGLVFGMSNTVVTPPTAAACVALVQVSCGRNRAHGNAHARR